MEIDYLLVDPTLNDISKYLKKLGPKGIPLITYDTSSGKYTIDLNPVGGILLKKAYPPHQPVHSPQRGVYEIYCDPNNIQHLHASVLNILQTGGTVIQDELSEIRFKFSALHLLCGTQSWKYWQMLLNYAEFRKDFAYYKRAAEFVMQLYDDNAGSVLDVGTKDVMVTLNLLPESLEKYALDNEFPPEFKQPEGITLIHQDFFSYNLDKKFDIVLCQQVLEHMEEPEKAFAKLRTLAESVLVISVPYGSWHGSPFDPITQETVRIWSSGMEPALEDIVTDWGAQRYVAGYKL